jgi:hypothetical protein
MESLEKVERLIQQIDGAADPSIRAAARELVQTLMDFHGAGIERMIELIGASGESGASTVGSIGRDDLAGALLLLYGLHPDDVETRVRRAVNKLRNVELESVIDGVVRVRIGGNGGAHVDRGAIEAAIYSLAPEVNAVVIEGAHEANFVPLEMLTSAGR